MLRIKTEVLCVWGTMCDFHNFGLIFVGQMHCLPQRLKSTLFEIFSNGGCPKGTRSVEKISNNIDFSLWGNRATTWEYFLTFSSETKIMKIRHSAPVLMYVPAPKICPIPMYALFVIQPTVGSGICLLWIEKHSTLCCWFNCTSLYSSFVGHAYIIVFLTWKTMKYVIKTPIIQSSCSMTSMKLSSQIKLVV